MSPITRFWRNHATKFLGAVTTIGAACNGGDHYLTQALTNGQHASVSLLLTVVGAMTVQRGFENSKNLK